MRWLQSKDGAIAGGATNSYKGRYEKPPAELPRFYGMAYDPSPVFGDPPSNDWFGFQLWAMQRIAELYYETGDENAELILDRWVAWAVGNTKLDKQGGYQIPSTLKWTGKPAQSWGEGDAKRFFKKDVSYNQTLRVEVVSTTDDVGTSAALVHTLTFYAAKKKDEAIAKLCSELLDRMWTRYRDELGVASPEVRKDYARFADRVHIPASYSGKMPNGDLVEPGATFKSLRTSYEDDPEWPKVKAYLDGGAAPEFRYHRFWAQAQLALAYGTHGWLFP
jgi:hypothetical protein